MRLPKKILEGRTRRSPSSTFKNLPRWYVLGSLAALPNPNATHLLDIDRHDALRLMLLHRARGGLPRASHPRFSLLGFAQTFSSSFLLDSQSYVTRFQEARRLPARQGFRQNSPR